MPPVFTSSTHWQALSNLQGSSYRVAVILPEALYWIFTQPNPSVVSTPAYTIFKAAMKAPWTSLALIFSPLKSRSLAGAGVLHDGTTKTQIKSRPGRGVDAHVRHRPGDDQLIYAVFLQHFQ